MMKKVANRYLVLIVWVLFFALWNVLLFCFADLDKAEFNFWAAYAFLAAAFVIVGVMLSLVKLSKPVIFSNIVLFYIVSGVYFGITFIMNVIFLCIPSWNDPKAVVIPNVILLVLYVAALVVCYMAFSHVATVEKNVQEKTQNLRTLAVSAGALVYSAKDDEVKREITKLKDNISFSDPMGVAATAEIEEQLKTQLEVVKTLLASGAEKEAVLDALAQAQGILNTRNELLRSVK